MLLVALPGLLAALADGALAAVVIAAGLSLIDVGAMVRLWRVGSSEFWLALVSFLGVALVGVIPGVFIAVALSLLAFIQRAWWPHDAVLGRADGVKGYHDLTYYPDARQIPGLLLYRFDAPLFFANADVFRDRVRERIAEADEPIRWVVIAAEPITDVDTTAAAMLDGLKRELDGRGITLAFAELKDPVKEKLRRYGALTDMPDESIFPTVGAAVSALPEGDRPAVDGLGGGGPVSGLTRPSRGPARDDRRQDGVEVADHGIGRARHHRRVAVGVDRQDRLGRAGADHVLDRPADAAGDVQVGRDPRPGLADLLGVRPPAGRGHDARDARRSRQAARRARRAARSPRRSRRRGRHRPRRARRPARSPPPRPGRASDPDAEVAIGEVRRERLDRGRRAPAPAAAGANACGATVSRRIGPSSRASSSRLPPQRWRVTCHGSPGRTSVTLAARSRPRRAAAWARISAPRSLPVPITTAGDSRSISWARARPSASGA